MDKIINFIEDRIWAINHVISNLEKDNDNSNNEILKNSNKRRIVELMERKNEAELILKEVKNYEK